MLALDIGEVRVGIATSDATGTLAFPVQVLSCDEVLGMARTFTRVLEDNEPELLVIGLPLSLSGEENTQAERVRTLAQQIAANTNLPTEFIDERYSSGDAKRILREQGLSEKEMRGKIDMHAAALFLQTWLDMNKIDTIET